MQSLERDKELRKEQEAKLKRFATERKGETQVGSKNGSVSPGRRNGLNRSLLSQSKQSRSKGRSSNTGRSDS